MTEQGQLSPWIIEPPDDLLQKHKHLQPMNEALAYKFARQLEESQQNPQPPVTEDDLKIVGNALWNALNLNEEEVAPWLVNGQQFRSVIIQSNQPDVLSLPWELLYFPEKGFLGWLEEFALSRHMPQWNCPVPPLQQGPLHVLLFTSLPEDAVDDRIDVESAQAMVIEALLPSIKQGKVKLEVPDDGRLSTLKELLHSFKPHLVFLYSHGCFVQAQKPDETSYGTIMLEDEDGYKTSVRDSELAELFHGTAVQCLVLSACESGMASSQRLNEGLARKLHFQGIPHVVGMRESVFVVAASQFIQEFLAALTLQFNIDVALQRGRRGINQFIETLFQSHWSLPLLLSHSGQKQLIQWNFTPEPPQVDFTKRNYRGIALPQMFIGLRKELRQLTKLVRHDQFEHCLIYAPGGQGKTALAGKLAYALQLNEVEVFAFSYQQQKSFDQFLVKLKHKLPKEVNASLSEARTELDDDKDWADLYLEKLLQQYPKGILLFLDNLESVQDEDTLEIEDATLNAWIQAALEFGDPRIKLLVTTRWLPRSWPEGKSQLLDHTTYGDFLRLAQSTNLSYDFLKDKKRLKNAYRVLRGNARGLELFAAAVSELKPKEESEFLQALEGAKAELQTNMAIAKIVEHLPEEALLLLRQMTAFAIAVPVEGLQCLHAEFWNEDKLAAALKRLVSVSLVEVSDHTIHPDEGEPYEVREYLCNPLVVDWLAKQSLPSLQSSMQDLRKVAAEYLLELFEQDRNTVGHGIAVHQALHAAGQTDKAHQFALDKLFGWFTRQGMYRTLLEDWLPDMLQSENPKIKADALNQQGKLNWHTGSFAEALVPHEKALAIYQELQDQEREGQVLNNISQIYQVRGDLDTALDYLQRSLVIRQRIGDKAGEGTTLNNISQIYDARGDFDTALDYLQRSLTIFEQIGDKSSEGTTLNNISQIYQDRGDLGTALDYLQRSLVISQQIGDVAGLSESLYNLGHIHGAKDNSQEALVCWVQAYQLASKMRYAQALDALTSIADHLELPGGLQGWQDLAERMGMQDEAE